MGKSTINGVFSIAMLVYQRVCHYVVSPQSPLSALTHIHAIARSRCLLSMGCTNMAHGRLHDLTNI